MARRPTAKATGASAVGPSDPNAVTYGTAFVDDANLTADSIGATGPSRTSSRAGSARVPSTNLSDPAAIARLHPWLRQQLRRTPSRAPPSTAMVRRVRLAGAETTVVAFSWPSMGKLITLPFPDALIADQTVAGPVRPFRSPPSSANLERSSAAPAPRAIGVPAGPAGQLGACSAIESWFAPATAMPCCSTR